MGPRLIPTPGPIDLKKYSWPQKVTGSLEVAMTYFMTPKVTVTFVVNLT